MKSCTLITALLLLLLPVTLPAAEYIESFHSDIQIQRNGDLLVTETIRVYAEGAIIRRGIYRDYPTRYQDQHGRQLNVGFELLSVKRDNRAEPHHSESRANGMRVYIGERNVYLEPGFYQYEIHYRTTRQLGFFDDFDELYWNVTGNNWEFEIRHATAQVTLPGAAETISLTGYTGRQGSTVQNLDWRRLNDSQLYFETTQPLPRHAGLTIVSGFPKGLITEPDEAQRRAWFIEDNKSAIIVVTGMLGLLIYYLLLWHWVGRDPQAGVVIPRYRAPAGYSPASMRFIERMGYDKTCFTSAIINLAVKGAIEIGGDDGDFQLKKTGPARTPLAAGETQVVDGLFAGGNNHVSIEKTNHSILSAAIAQHKRSLKRDYEKQYFRTNSWLVLPAVLATLAIIVAAIANLQSQEMIFKTVFLGMFTLIPLSIIYTALKRIISMGRNGFLRYGIFLAPMFIFFGFFFTSGFPLMDFAEGVPLSLVIGLVSMIALHYFFYQWLKAPTLAGRRLLDQVDGFKHYLQVAEEDEIALQGAPRFSSEIYETWLPFAIALDLENEWTKKLDRAVAAGAVAGGYSQPGWYHGRSHSDRHFSTTLAGSFNSAIASSSIAPGSSSGSSGGSSGGGGGGGGGGGW